jgi:quinol monooxygenase YgiN
MKVSKWVDLGQEVEIDITAEDVRHALSEAFAVVTEDRLGEEGPNRYDVMRTLNDIAAFLNGLTDEHIALLNHHQRAACADLFAKSSERFVNVPITR